MSDDSGREGRRGGGMKDKTLSQKAGKVHGVISRGEQAWCYLCSSQHRWETPCKAISEHPRLSRIA